MKGYLLRYRVLFCVVCKVRRRHDFIGINDRGTWAKCCTCDHEVG